MDIQVLTQNSPTAEVDSGFESQASDQQGTSPTREAKEGKLFVGGLHWATTEESLRAHFSEYGRIVEVAVMRDGQTGRSRGFGFVKFADGSVIDDIVCKEHVIDGKPVDPKKAVPKQQQDPTEKVFVGGITSEMDKNVLYETFSVFGEVFDVNIVTDKQTGNTRGFAFITFASVDGAERALNAESVEIHGKKVEIRTATPKNRTHTTSAALSFSGLSEKEMAGYGYMNPGFVNMAAYGMNYPFNPAFIAGYFGANAASGAGTALGNGATQWDYYNNPSSIWGSSGFGSMGFPDSERTRSWDGEEPLGKFEKGLRHQDTRYGKASSPQRQSSRSKSPLRNRLQLRSPSPDRHYREDRYYRDKPLAARRNARPRSDLYSPMDYQRDDDRRLRRPRDFEADFSDSANVPRPRDRDRRHVDGRDVVYRRR